MLGRLKTLLRQRFSEADEPIAPICELAEPVATVTPLTPNPLPPRVGNMSERAEAAVSDLSSEFEDWLQVDLNALLDAWRRVQETPQNQSAAKDLFHAAHNLSGMGATYGRPEIGRLCRSLSKLMSRGNLRADTALIGLHVDACRAAKIGASGGDIASAVCEALEAEVSKLRAA